MKAQHLAMLNAARHARKAAVLATSLTGANDLLIVEDEDTDPGLRAMAQQALQTGKAGIAEIEGSRYFLNPHLPPARIVIIGAVHIGQYLARMAMLSGFDISIVDPRTAFATPERFAGIDLIAEWPADALETHPLDAYTALVAISHDPKLDDFALVKALEAKCFYVGALGSRKSHAARLERLRAEGLNQAALQTIRGPVGLRINAASPAEIAVSILAEIIQTLRNRDALTVGLAEQ